MVRYAQVQTADEEKEAKGKPQSTSKGRSGPFTLVMEKSMAISARTRKWTKAIHLGNKNAEMGDF
jgi:hypothetical protein